MVVQVQPISLVRLASVEEPIISTYKKTQDIFAQMKEESVTASQHPFPHPLPKKMHRVMHYEFFSQVQTVNQH